MHTPNGGDIGPERRRHGHHPWGAEASAKVHNSPRIALCCGWQVAGTGCRGCGAPVETS
jgi:hypothetical protein